MKSDAFVGAGLAPAHGQPQGGNRKGCPYNKRIVVFKGSIAQTVV